MAEKTVLITQQLLKPIKILKWKVNEGCSMSIGRVILLYDFDGAHKTEHRKLKSTQAGTVHKLISPEGAIVKPGEPLIQLRACIHPTVMKDMCAECGADLRKNDENNTTASVPMVHTIPDLKVSEESAQKLGKADGERLIRDRKLVLLVDLDQTLIHTTNDNIPPNIKDVYHFQLYGSNSPWYHTRLRPGTHRFLSNMSPYFELHICTFGARNYAHTITMFLENDRSYFSNRILSRDECFDPTSKKANLKALFPCGDNMVCIIDDREDVWNHALNLIHVKPYHFFQHTGDINAPPGLDKQENDEKEGVDLSKIKKRILKPNGKNTTVKEGVNGDKNENGVVNGESGNNEKEENFGRVDKEKEIGSDLCKVDGNEEKKDNEENNDLMGKEEKNDLMGTEEQKNLMNKEQKNDLMDKEKQNDLMCKEKKIDSMGMEEKNYLIKEENEEKKENRTTEEEEKVATVEINLKKSVSLNKDVGGKDEENMELFEGETKINESKCVEKMDESKCIEKMDETVPQETLIPSIAENIKEDSKDAKEEPSVKVSVNSDSDDKTVMIKTKVENVDAEVKSVEIKEPKLEITIKKTLKKDDDDLIEIDDPDDYLLHLEDILTRIHRKFYEEYDKMESGEVPDLKQVIPNVRNQILKGTKLVFSGLVPTHIKLEQSKAYQVARSLGAFVSQDLEEDSTHLVAVRPGTAKVNAGRRRKNLKIVTPDWLWSCAERWEHVDEAIYPLNSRGSKNRHPPPHCSSPEHVPLYPTHNAPIMRKRTPSGRFMDTINPLMSFSSDDIADMDKEVEDILDDESDESEEEPSKEKPTKPELKAIKENEDSSSSSEESMTADYPRGFKRTREKCKLELGEEDFMESSVDEFPSTKFRRGEQLDSDLDIGQDSNSEGGEAEGDEGEWNMMGAALEREFLSNN